MEDEIQVWPLLEGQHRPGGTVKERNPRAVLLETVKEMVIAFGGDISRFDEIQQLSRQHFAVSRHDEAVTAYGLDCAISTYEHLKRKQEEK